MMFVACTLYNLSSQMLMSVRIQVYAIRYVITQRDPTGAVAVMAISCKVISVIVKVCSLAQCAVPILYTMQNILNTL